jgi:hypothetical protein
MPKTTKAKIWLLKTLGVKVFYKKLKIKQTISRIFFEHDGYVKMH